MKRSVISFVCILACTTAMAAGNPDTGKSRSLICVGCHGYDGNSTNPIYPALAGQGQDYLIKQLRDFKSGARTDAHMTSMVAAVNMDDIADIAAYFAAQQRKPASTASQDSETGKLIYQNGIAAKDLAACSSCHGADGKGNDAIKFPSLAGQHTDYVAKMLKDFRSGERHNDTQSMMRDIAAALDDREIEALSRYIATLR